MPNPAKRHTDTASVESLLASKLCGFVPLSSRELQCLADLQSMPVRVERGGELAHEGQTGHKVHVLQSGWAVSFKLLPDGGRQIITFPLAGDCIGLRSILLSTCDHSCTALTDTVVTSIEAAQMLRAFNEFPRLGAAILWAASRDEAMVVEHLVDIGRRSALERTAHFLLELAERLRLVGLATATEFPCPLNQYVLADALGLTAIHVNRVLRQLRERGLLTFKDRRVVIHDFAALATLAGFHPQQPVRPPRPGE